MPFDHLRHFIDTLRAQRELVEVKEAVDPYLEVCEITDRVVKRGGPALLFTNVKGAAMPVVTNLVGSWRRIGLALNAASLDDIANRLEELIKVEPPTSFMDKLKVLPRLGAVASYLPKTVSRGRCQEVVMNPPDLKKLPVLTTWPLDGGPFITLPLVFTKDPTTGVRNCGIYRMQVYDSLTAGMHWHKHKVGAHHYRDSEGRKLERMPVAVALGGDPALIYAGTAPLPPMFDEMLFAGFLRQRKVEMVKCLTCDLEVPADAEIVIEGYVVPGELRAEGPFGDHTGYYSLVDDYPVFHVTAITHCRDPIYPATVVGKPPQEDAFLGKATERIFLPLMKMTLPEIVDINLPIEGVFHNLAIVSIKKEYPGHARKVCYALWGLGQMALEKCIIVVDHFVDVQNPREVLFRVGANVAPERDMFFVKGPMDALDHAAERHHFGSKVGIDATHKLPEEGQTQPWPEEIAMSGDVKARIDSLWPRLGLGPL